jgi:hypothetical protein
MHKQIKEVVVEVLLYKTQEVIHKYLEEQVEKE